MATGLVSTALGTATPALATQAGGQTLMNGSQAMPIHPADQTGLVATANGAAAPVSIPSASTPSLSNGGVSPGAAQTTLTPDMTTAGQFQKLMADGSPLITQAVTKSNENWNDRGLVNSSMASEAGQIAAANAALPIAQSDANANLTTGQANTQQQNALTNTAMGDATSLTNTGVNANTQKMVANTEANYRTDQQLQSSLAALQSNYTSQRSAIMQNTTMDATSKAAALRSLDAQYKSDSNVLGSVAGIDVSSLMSGV